MNNDSMNCGEVKEIIKNLSPKIFRKTEQESLKEHLNECSECRQLYKETLSLNKLLDEWEAPKAKVNLQAGIMAKIAQVEKEKLQPIQPQDFWGQFRLSLGYRLSVPALAAMILMFLLCGSITVNLFLLSRLPRAGTIAERIDRGSSKIPSTENVVEDRIEGSQKALVKQPPFVYTAENGYLGYYQDAIQAGVLQPVIIVILGAPPVLPPQPDLSSKDISGI